MATTTSPFRKRWEALRTRGFAPSADEAPTNITLAIKCAPPRTAKIMSKASIKCGFLVKRNEQGVWQKRYCALVPHTFLYYYETDEADQPRGVIDMEYYTDLSMDEKQIIKLSTQEGMAGRMFYFQVADGETEANEWVSSLNHGRFFTVRDERDAYRELQDEYSTQCKSAQEGVAQANAERQQAQADLMAHTRASATDLVKAKLLLQELGGAGASAEASLKGEAEASDMAGVLERIRTLMAARDRRWNQRLRDMEDQGEQSRAQAQSKEEVWSSKYDDLKSAIGRLHGDLEEERRRSCGLQVQVDSTREHSQLIEAQLSESQINLKVLSKEHKALEAKLAELSEQKRVLVKAIKSARSELQESRKANKKLLVAYASMDSKCQALKAQAAEPEGGVELPPSMVRPDTCSPCSVGSLSVDTGGTNEDSVSFTSQDLEQLHSVQLLASQASASDGEGGSNHNSDEHNNQPTKRSDSVTAGDDQTAVPLPPPIDTSTESPSMWHRSGRSNSSMSPPKMGQRGAHLGGASSGSVPSLFRSSSLSPHHATAKAQQSSTPSLVKGFGSKLRVLLNEVESIDGYIFGQSHPPPDMSTAQQHAQEQQNYVGLDGIPRSLSLPTQEEEASEGVKQGQPPPSADARRCSGCDGMTEGPKSSSTCRCREPSSGDAAGGTVVERGGGGGGGVMATPAKEASTGSSKSSFLSIFGRADSGPFGRSRGGSVFGSSSLFSTGESTRSRDGSLNDSGASATNVSTSSGGAFALPSVPRTAKLKLESPRSSNDSI